MKARNNALAHRKRRYQDHELDILCPTGFEIVSYPAFDKALSVTPLSFFTWTDMIEANPRMAAGWGLKRTDR